MCSHQKVSGLSWHLRNLCWWLVPIMPIELPKPRQLDQFHVTVEKAHVDRSGQQFMRPIPGNRIRPSPVPRDRWHPADDTWRPRIIQRSVLEHRGMVLSHGIFPPIRAVGYDWSSCWIVNSALGIEIHVSRAWCKNEPVISYPSVWSSVDQPDIHPIAAGSKFRKPILVQNTPLAQVGPIIRLFPIRKVPGSIYSSVTHRRRGFQRRVGT